MPDVGVGPGDRAQMVWTVKGPSLTLLVTPTIPPLTTYSEHLGVQL